MHARSGSASSGSHGSGSRARRRSSCRGGGSGHNSCRGAQGALPVSVCSSQVCADHGALTLVPPRGSSGVRSTGLLHRPAQHLIPHVEQHAQRSSCCCSGPTWEMCMLQQRAAAHRCFPSDHCLACFAAGCTTVTVSCCSRCAWGPRLSRGGHFQVVVCLGVCKLTLELGCSPGY